MLLLWFFRIFRLTHTLRPFIDPLLQATQIYLPKRKCRTNTQSRNRDELQNYQLKTCEIVSESGQKYHVSYKMLFTMMDGSVCNILSDTHSTSKCIIYGATPKDLNTEKVLNRLLKILNYRFGLSTLRCWIKFFECLLHIGYRISIKTWQVRGNKSK